MSAAAALAGFLAAAVGGYSVLRLLPGRLRGFEAFAWSLAIGLLAHAALVAIRGAAGAAPGMLAFLGLDASFLAFSFALRRRHAGAPGAAESRERAPSDRRVVLLGLAASAGFLLFVFQSAAAPPSATDYLAIWGLKGRTIAESGGIPSRLFHDPALAWAHPEYPLLVPLTLAAIARFAGRWSESGVVVFYVLCQAATIAALFGFRARRGSAVRGALAAALAALCVGLYARGNLGTAEIPMALGFVLLAEAYLDSLAEEPGALARLSIAAFFCASAKKEGALLAILFALWALVASGAVGRVRLRIAFAATVPAVAHAAILRLSTGPVRARDFDLGLLEPARWSELPPRLSEAAVRIFSVSLIPALPAILAITVFFLATRRGDADVLLPALASQVLVYAAACAFSAFSVRWHVDSALSRITLALFPAAALVISGRRIADRPARSPA